MSIHLVPPAPHHPADQPAQDAQYYRRVLHDLIDIGADLARLVQRQADAAAAPPAQASSEQQAADRAPGFAPGLAPGLAPGFAPGFAIAFDRIARAVRRTIVLARHVAEPATPAAHSARHEAERRVAARRRIIREVEDAIQRTEADTEAETLHAEFLDRLDAPDLDDDILHRPIADIIADICRDLGLAAPAGSHPWKRRTAEDVIALCTRAAAVQSPSVPIVVHTGQPGADPPSAPHGPIPLHGPPPSRSH